MHSLHNLNWDDLRFVLAVAEHASVAAAARALGVNHATVLRRVASFESATGGPVFEKGATGYRLREDRVAVIEAMRAAASHISEVADLMRPVAQTGGRILRLTSVDTLCTTVLAWEMARILRRIAPLRIEIVSSNQHLDFSRMQADVSLRPAQHLPDDMTGDCVGQMALAVYARDAQVTGWLGMAGPLARSGAMRSLQSLAPAAEMVASADSFLVIRSLAEMGRGRAVLPVVLGDASPCLHRQDGYAPLDSIPLWVGCHKDLAQNGMIQTVMEAVSAALRAQSGKLLGVSRP